MCSHRLIVNVGPKWKHDWFGFRDGDQDRNAFFLVFGWQDHQKVKRETGKPREYNCMNWSIYTLSVRHELDRRMFSPNRSLTLTDLYKHF